MEEETGTQHAAEDKENAEIINPLISAPEHLFFVRWSFSLSMVSLYNPGVKRPTLTHTIFPLSLAKIKRFWGTLLTLSVAVGSDSDALLHSSYAQRGFM